MIYVLDLYYGQFDLFAQKPPDPRDKKLIEKIQNFYELIDEFRRFLYYDVLKPLSTWESEEWKPVYDTLYKIYGSKERADSWGFFYEILYESRFNGRKFQRALTAIWNLSGEIQAASENFKRIRARWEGKGF